MKLILYTLFFLIYSTQLLADNKKAGKIEQGTYIPKNQNDEEIHQNMEKESDDTKSTFVSSEIKYKNYEEVFPVQVLLTVSRENALENKNYLNSIGYKGAFIKVTKAPDNTVFYKVYSGNYPTETQAIKEKRKIRLKFKRYKRAFVDRDK